MNCVSVAVSGRLQFPDVSEMTLRTDLKVLDEEKKILSVHGGAKSVRVIIGTDDFLNRKSVAILRKKKRLPKKPQSCFIRTQHFSGFRIMWICNSRLRGLDFFCALKFRFFRRRHKRESEGTDFSRQA